MRVEPVRSVELLPLQRVASLCRVLLDAGEALFDVAQEAKRPFIVSAGDRDIQALGTSFVVRRDDQKVSVTLMEGKVGVKEVAPLVPPISATVLAPGERATFEKRGATAKKDRPVLEKLTARSAGRCRSTICRCLMRSWR